MERNLNPTTDCIKRAVEQCNRIESSLEGCLRVLQEGCVPCLPKTVQEETAKPPALTLDRKHSYVICVGKKSPDLIEVDETTDLRENANIRYLLSCADVKLQQVLSSQQRIIQRLSDVHDVLIEKNRRQREETEEQPRQLRK